MVNNDLAEAYGVPTKRLNEQVKHNANRFPRDFSFILTETEGTELPSTGNQRKLTRMGGVFEDGRIASLNKSPFDFQFAFTVEYVRCQPGTSWAF